MAYRQWGIENDLRWSEVVRRPVALAKMRGMVRTGEARELRIGSGLSLREVADDIGVNPTSVYHWEQGVCLPRGPHALKYARLLDALRKATR